MLSIRYRYSQYVPYKLDMRFVRSVFVGRTLNTSMYFGISFTYISCTLLARWTYSYAMHTLHTRYASLSQAVMYDNVCQRMSNLSITFMNLCIAHSLRTPNV